jgi:hypothetical protein
MQIPSRIAEGREGRGGWARKEATTPSNFYIGLKVAALLLSGVGKCMQITFGENCRRGIHTPPTQPPPAVIVTCNGIRKAQDKRMKRTKQPESIMWLIFHCGWLIFKNAYIVFSYEFSVCLRWYIMIIKSGFTITVFQTVILNLSILLT